APQGRGVLGAARGDAPARAREKRGPGPDRRHLDQGQGARRDDRPDRAPARRGGAALRHIPVPPRDHRALRPAGRVPVRHRPPAAQAKPNPAAAAKPDSAKRDSVAAPGLVREVFSYEGGGRDPFLSLLRSGDIRPLLSDLRLVGIYYDGRYPARSVAVLRDVTNSKVYRVKPGNIIGRLKA